VIAPGRAAKQVYLSDREEAALDQIAVLSIGGEFLRPEYSVHLRRMPKAAPLVNTGFF
jgi:hypothetical protein